MFQRPGNMRWQSGAASNSIKNRISIRSASRGLGLTARDSIEKRPQVESNHTRSEQGREGRYLGSQKRKILRKNLANLNY